VIQSNLLLGIKGNVSFDSWLARARSRQIITFAKTSDMTFAFLSLGSISAVFVRAWIAYERKKIN